MRGKSVFKKLAFIAVAAVISSAAVVSSAAPAAAQGISVRLGDGGHRDGYRGGGYRRHSDFGRRDRGYHRGWDRRPRGRTIIVR
jgi:hypothetical protein